MHKRLLIMLLGIVLTMTGCAGGGGGSSDSSHEESFTTNKSENIAGGSSVSGFNSDVSESIDSSDSSESVDSSDSSDSSVDNLETQDDETVSGKVDKDMLVYRCTASVDTLDFDKSLSDFKKMVSDAGGFLESENLSDGGDNYSYYYIEESDKHAVYTATVRIPSSKYEDFTTKFGDLGDVRSKVSNVENMNQEYTDVTTALKIYREQEKNYIDRIAKADETYAMQLEQELTELEIKIAQLESQINKIETDVAYSYVDMTIRHVQKYSLHGDTDTFTMRIKDSFGGSWDSFMAVIEWFIVLIIYIWYYVVIIAVIVILVRKRSKRVKKNKNNINSVNKSDTSVKTYNLDLMLKNSSDSKDLASEMTEETNKDETDKSEM